MTAFDRDLYFLDTETLGLDREAPVWEFAAIRIHDGEEVARTEFLIEHDRGGWLDTLPEQFRADYRARYWAELAIPQHQAAREIRLMTDGAIIAGSNPAFDMDRLELLLRQAGEEPGWHYHPLDIPSMVIGCITEGIPGVAERLTWRSTDLSRLVGVDPDGFARHTAMGDVQWCLAQWRQMTAKSLLTEPAVAAVYGHLDAPIPLLPADDGYPIGQVRG